MVPERQHADGNRAQAFEQFAGALREGDGVANPVRVSVRERRAFQFDVGDRRDDRIAGNRRCGALSDAGAFLGLNPAQHAVPPSVA